LLNSIKVRDGYAQTMSYNGNSQLATVTDSFNRSMQLTYQTNLLRTLTAPSGLVLTYGYNSSGVTPGKLDRLVSVTYSTTPVSSQSYVYENAGFPFSMTGIFPPMHVIAVKRKLAEANPGLMKAIFDAFAQGQKVARDRLFDSAALCTMLPWQLESLIFTEQRLGHDYWPVGLAKNHAMLKVIVRYMVEDGLIATEFAPEELFSDDDILKT